MSDLAINGGAKVAPNGLTLRRLFGIDEKQAVMALFDRVTESGSGAMGYSGVEEEAYCKAFCEMHGGGFADGVNSGTNALFVALGATDPRPGAEVIVPPITDPGGAMPVTMLNCIPVSADAEKGSVYNTGPAEIAKVITPRTHAVIVAHISGLPVDMDGILALAKKHSLYVIEDCAQSHLTKYKGRLAGTMGHIAAFSTMFGKQHSSGGQGGIVYTKDEQL
ncbi:MAG: hypothetical protein GXY38_02755, partial [Planctomycetes bacterium]|nr:hypothetical protein [Planctomycetota bacterium]